MLNLVREMQRELGLSLLFISTTSPWSGTSPARGRHASGRIVEAGPTASVLGDPQHDYTRQLLAAVPGRGGHAITPAITHPEESAVNRTIDTAHWEQRLAELIEKHEVPALSSASW